MIELQDPPATSPILLPHRSQLADLLVSSVIPAASWASLPIKDRKRIEGSPDLVQQLHMLIERGLLTEYQAKRIRSGNWNGLILDNYRILDQIGVGGTGIVYRAEHRFMRQTVAIKVLKQTVAPNDPQRGRFVAEIRAVSCLKHPNIAAALNAGEIPNRLPGGEKAYYLVMEYVEGQDLDTIVCNEGPLSVRRAFEVVQQLTNALTEAHRHGIIHRDVKPSNVRVASDGQIKLLDFGLALCPRHRSTLPGVPMGSPEYMAPEQVRDASASNARTDVYGLGGVLFWCLTGQAPFPAPKNIFQCLMTRVNQAPPSAVHVRPGLPIYLDAVLACAMATDPRYRFPSAAALMRALALLPE